HYSSKYFLYSSSVILCFVTLNPLILISSATIVIAINEYNPNVNALVNTSTVVKALIKNPIRIPVTTATTKDIAPIITLATKLRIKFFTTTSPLSHTLIHTLAHEVYPHSIRPLAPVFKKFSYISRPKSSLSILFSMHKSFVSSINCSTNSTNSSCVISCSWLFLLLHRLSSTLLTMLLSVPCTASHLLSFIFSGNCSLFLQPQRHQRNSIGHIVKQRSSWRPNLVNLATIIFLNCFGYHLLVLPFTIRPCNRSSPRFHCRVTNLDQSILVRQFMLEYSVCFDDGSCATDLPYY